ncbi:conserved hypothetical protein [Thiomonas sp. CB3]|nr:conserved hypothetical protein [Thiomonas sp. CB3]
MNQLAFYVAAILGQAAPVRIAHSSVETSCWEDQGFQVCREVTTYHFANGVVIRRTVERDNFPQHAGGCGETWVSDEVLATGQLGGVEPSRKVFENACREAFWAAYHVAT